MAKHTIAVLVENRAGVLTRVSGLFSRRGFNIESLAVGTTEDPNISRMTIVVDGDDQTLEQITKQLYKLIDTVKVYDLSGASAVDREVVLIKVHANTETRPELMQIVDIFRANIVDVAEDSVIIEITGSSEKVASLEEMIRRFGIKELVRTGKIAMQRGLGV